MRSSEGKRMSAGNTAVRKYREESPNRLTADEKNKLILEYAPLIRFIELDD